MKKLFIKNHQIGGYVQKDTTKKKNEYRYLYSLLSIFKKKKSNRLVKITFCIFYFLFLINFFDLLFTDICQPQESISYEQK